MLYMDDSYLKEFNAKVKSADGKFVVLDRTAFFPKGGGVEWDTGAIVRKRDNKQFRVYFVGKFDGRISHETDKGLEAGDEVHCTIDWDRRHMLMRYHTGTHVLTGVLSRDYDLLVTGNQLTTEKGRIDLNMETLDLDIIKEAFHKANNIIRDGGPVKIYYVSVDEAKKDPTLFKLAAGFKHNLEKIRIVDVGFDRQADGGCHVRDLSEVGKLVFTDAVNKGKQNRRIYFRVE